MSVTHINRSRTRITPLLGVLLLASALAGCASYYRVTDPASGKTYYTKDVDEKKQGAVEFTDARTGSKVTMQNSEVAKISEKEFKANVKPK